VAAAAEGGAAGEGAGAGDHRDELTTAQQGDRRGGVVYHTIQFAVGFVADLEVSPRQPLERVRIRPGDRFPAQVRPGAIETDRGPVEVADLFFEDGTATRRVPFAHFAFVG
jgi:hypothetical protein